MGDEQQLVKSPSSDPFDPLREYLKAEFSNLHRRIDDKAAESGRRFDEVDKVLQGNGRPGLVSVVAVHEERITDIEGGDHRAAARHGTIWGGATSLIVSVIIGVLAAFGVKPN